MTCVAAQMAPPAEAIAAELLDKERREAKAERTLGNLPLPSKLPSPMLFFRSRIIMFIKASVICARAFIAVAIFSSASAVLFVLSAAAEESLATILAPTDGANLEAKRIVQARI
jgi:hypothetical protein